IVFNNTVALSGGSGTMIIDNVRFLSNDLITIGLQSNLNVTFIHCFIELVNTGSGGIHPVRIDGTNSIITFNSCQMLFDIANTSMSKKNYYFYNIFNTQGRPVENNILRVCECTHILNGVGPIESVGVCVARICNNNRFEFFNNKNIMNVTEVNADANDVLVPYLMDKSINDQFNVYNDRNIYNGSQSVGNSYMALIKDLSEESEICVSHTTLELPGAPLGVIRYKGENSCSDCVLKILNCVWKDYDSCPLDSPNTVGDVFYK
ncbi:unnamed protein product, partial [marine sediment metagenome]